MDELRQGVNEIKLQLQQESMKPSSQHNRADSLLTPESLVENDDEVSSLSDHLNEMTRAATTVQATTLTPQTTSTRTLKPKSAYSTLPDSSAADIDEPFTREDPSECTHLEPLKELARRFKQQAEYDLDHLRYKDAERHLLESIACFKELHDLHRIPFSTYEDMQRKLAKIYQKLGKWTAAKQIYQQADKQPLVYEHEPGWKNVTVEQNIDTEHKASVNYDHAELLLDEFVNSSKFPTSPIEDSTDCWQSLHKAEKLAKRAFRIRRDRHGKDHDDCKQSAKLLIKIYDKFPDKSIYVETYSDLYILDDEHRRNTLLTSSSATSTSQSRSLVPGTGPHLIDAVEDHSIPYNDVVQLHLAGATLTALEQTEDGNSVMMIAMDCRNKDCERCGAIVDKLLRLGVDRDAPFVYSVRRNRIEDCRFLLHHDANIDRPDVDKLTPLMHAIKQERADMVTFLLSENADVNARGMRGQTALHVATHKRNKEIFMLLLKKDGLDLDATDDSGQTALHLCAKQDNIEFAQKLHRRGANLNIIDKSGRNRTPLWIAVREDRHDFARMLAKTGAIVDTQALPAPVSRDMRNLLNKYRTQASGSMSTT